MHVKDVQACINALGTDHAYIDPWCGQHITLDGSFTIDELRAILALMELVDPPTVR